MRIFGYNLYINKVVDKNGNKRCPHPITVAGIDEDGYEFVKCDDCNHITFNTTKIKWFNDKPKYITLDEIARRMCVPPTTIRTWKDRFSDSFTTKKIAGKRWGLYPEKSIKTFLLIKHGYSSGLITEDIQEMLKGRV